MPNVRPLVRPLVLALATLAAAGADGCSRDPSVALPTLDEARAFQATADAHFREDAVSPITATFSRYVAEGERLHVGLKGDELAVDEASGAQFTFAQLDGELVCERGCAETPAQIAERQSHALGHMTLLASPQSGAGRVVVHDPRAPERLEFKGRHWGPLDQTGIVAARFAPDQSGAPMSLTTSRGLQKELPIAGRFEFELGGERHSLVGFVSERAAGRLEVLVPFFDQSNGDGSYPAGRYLNLEFEEGAHAVAIDFNRATNPYCAYSEHYNCPVPPPGNAVSVRVDAGELVYAAH